MTEITSEQQFRLDTVGTLGKILARLESIDETNKNQDALFKEHRSNMRQALKDHSAVVEKKFSEVGETIKTIVDTQSNLKTYIDRVVGALCLLTIVVPIGLTALEVSTLFPSKDTVAVETGQT